MLNYLLLGDGMGILRTRGETALGADLTIAAPEGATLYWNGQAYHPVSGTFSVPRSAVRARNTVRLLTPRGSFRCEGIGCDGENVMPLGFDRDAALLAMGVCLTDALSTLDDLAAWVLEEKRRSETPLFS